MFDLPTFSFRRALNFLSSSTVCNHFVTNWNQQEEKERQSPPPGNTHLVEVNFRGVALSFPNPPDKVKLLNVVGLFSSFFCVLCLAYFCNGNLFLRAVPAWQQGENCFARGGVAISNLGIEIHRNKRQRKRKAKKHDHNHHHRHHHHRRHHHHHHHYKDHNDGGSTGDWEPPLLLFSPL